MTKDMNLQQLSACLSFFLEWNQCSKAEKEERGGEGKKETREGTRSTGERGMLQRGILETVLRGREHESVSVQIPQLTITYTHSSLQQ